ncbi:MAG: GTP 3',8-cyclase MoaA [Coriobacteriales bacterium]|jgi:cyclic pyranopterin phosphate synthase|nr:GTP 3',8-cyclase MoaA [Coriobacteriales bacterium]
MAYDQHGRAIDYLRISVTDRCNLRCLYCMPEEGVAWKPRKAMLTLEEICRLVRIASGEGFSRIRLTGGEPLVRLGIADLVRDIVRVAGIESVAMTTNGILLPKMAKTLKDAGLKRVNISLDTLDPAQFAHVTRWGDINDVFAGIEAALAVGFDPVKINTVVVRSLNQDLLSFARLSLDRPLHVRFIEYMPVGDSCGGEGLGWSESDTIPNEEIIGIINERARAAGLGDLVPCNSTTRGPDGWGPARYYHFDGAQGSVGFISALSRHFCSECNRLRLTAEGQLRPCLFSDDEYDMRHALRSHDDDAVRDMLRLALSAKPEEHHHKVGTKRLMSQIGG